MKDAVGQFSLQDFLGYLFPGLVSALGLALGISGVTGFDLEPRQLEWPWLVLILSLSCALGVVVSGLSGAQPPRAKRDDPKWREISEAGRAVLLELELGPAGKKLPEPQLSYVARSLALLVNPSAVPMILRQIAVRQFRRNMRPALVLLCLGLVDSVGRFSIERHHFVAWGVPLTLLLLACLGFAIWVLAQAEARSLEREERETYTAIMAWKAAERIGGEHTSPAP